MQKQEQQEQQGKERKSPSEIVLETLELVYGHAETGASLVVAVVVVVVEEAMIVVGHMKPRWAYEAKMVDDLAAASVVSILKANSGRKRGSA